VNSDDPGHYEGKPVHPMVSLVYALIPGLSQPEPGSNGLDVDARMVLDPPADPAVWGAVLTMGSERDARPGGSETAGAFGPFVLLEGTKRVNVALDRITIAPADPPRRTQSPAQRSFGTLEIELTSGTARWTPAQGA